jgi:PAS domain S-box-containing protein
MDTKNPQLSDSSILPFPHVAWKGKERLLRTVLDNMPLGVLLFDSNSQLVVCNRRYIEMYGLSQEVAKPGCTLRELIDNRKQVGTFSGDADDYIASLMEAIADGKILNNVVKLDDGRVISIVRQPIANGGWLAMHEDITERQRADEQIARMARHDAQSHHVARAAATRAQTRPTGRMPGCAVP